MDGGVGFPAYTGMLPNPMLTGALITTREGTLAGDAAMTLHENGPMDPRPPFLKFNTHVRDWEPKNKVESLQSSVRAALVEVELLRSIVFGVATDAGTSDVASAHLSFTTGGKLVEINRLKRPVFDNQVKLVEAFSALRAERMSEILAQAVPQTAHWSSIVGMSPERHRYTWELLGIGLRLTMLLGMQFKFAFDVQRAVRRSAAIQPMIATPGHAAFPSGHATEACFVAELLPLLIGDPAHPCAQNSCNLRSDSISRQLGRLALRIAENRVVAGVHYPVDSIAGQTLGVMLARYLVWLSGDELLGFDKPSLKVGAVAFPDPGTIKGIDEQPNLAGLLHEQAPNHIGQPTVHLPNDVPQAPVLKDMWVLARREWVGT
jgi:hypothetical protein